jgi:hypothetical protein
MSASWKPYLTDLKRRKSMADIFDEIDEELKKDRAQVLWARYGKYLIAAVAAVVLAVASAQGYKAWQTSQAETAANAYQAALEADDVAIALNDVIAGLTDGYEMLAQFRIAGEKAVNGDKLDAEMDYLALAEDKSIKPLYQQAALLLSVMNAPDGSDIAALQERLVPLTSVLGPWQGLAIELSAALDLQKGEALAARAKFEAIVALPEISPELRQRAQQMLTILQL